LLQVFLISTLGLVPGQSERILAIEFLIIGVVSWVAQVTVQVQYLRVRTGHPWSWIMHRAVLAQFATVPFIVAGIALWLGTPGALYWVVPGFVFFVYRWHRGRVGPASGNIALNALSNNEGPSP
jgi:hypothetical protein